MNKQNQSHHLSFKWHYYSIYAYLIQRTIGLTIDRNCNFPKFYCNLILDYERILKQMKLELRIFSQTGNGWINFYSNMYVVVYSII